MNQGDDSGNDCDQLPIVNHTTNRNANRVNVDCDEWFHFAFVNGVVCRSHGKHTTKFHSRNTCSKKISQRVILTINCQLMDVVMWLFVVVGVCEWMDPPMGGSIPFHPHPLIHPTTNPIV